MPTYQYECDNCDYNFEILQSIKDRKLKKCPKCGAFKLFRLIGAGVGIIFKGSGFYETDYKKKEPYKDETKPQSISTNKNSTPRTALSKKTEAKPSL